MVKNVEILHTQDDGSQKVFATWSLDDRGFAVCSNRHMQEELEEDGIAAGRMLYPRDGIEFLRFLPVAYSGSYCRARIIEE